MDIVITQEKIHLPPGAVVRLPGNWQDYQQLCHLLGDRSIPRIKYRTEEILLMAPLHEHSRNVGTIADIAKILLDYSEQDYEAFAPITIELLQQSGTIPDYCFYIDNCAAIVGKDRINWGIDPSPDLVIEVDVTSYTDVNDYLPYGIPEVWLLQKNTCVIYNLAGASYCIQTNSKYFPNINVSDIIEECLEKARQSNTSTAIRQLRQKFPAKK